ncbi:MAG: hypothetical protein UW07_C0004G0009 [Candidatus Nomurabacteria bacterium GW2011_GWF2_43_8]|uniref:Bacterial spore germination immunoglobulin-like domain-containing protein n=3 Tax=Candidatus Nomuraibacteriota TaxID=1752729 RepID=A0A0G1FRI7_9BACT|nr:MAG: hypothetical protein UW07_C0004G0009 [Candidatus Nomurabacteria bacterium GW2011_GWF2_43_8]
MRYNFTMRKTVTIIAFFIVIVLAGFIGIKELENGEPAYIEYQTERGKTIRLYTPQANGTIKSPLVIKGEARGNWFFEASFPITLVDWDGLIIAESYATAEGDWMTTEFVPFTATLEFKKPTYKNNGALILQKDNPSGLPEHDDALEIPIFFSE